MPTIAETVTRLAADLGDSAKATWSDADMTRCVNHVLEDLLAQGVGDAYFLDHAGDGTVVIRVDDHTGLDHITAVEHPYGEEPPHFCAFHYEYADSKEYIVLHTDEPPSASDTVRIHYVSLMGAVPKRLLECVLAGAAMYALEMEAARKAPTLNVDNWVARRYDALAAEKRARYQALLASLPPPPTPRGHGPNRAAWRSIDE